MVVIFALFRIKISKGKKLIKVNRDLKTILNRQFVNRENEEERGERIRLTDRRTKFLTNEDCNGCGREVDVNLIKKMNY